MTAIRICDECGDAHWADRPHICPSRDTRRMAETGNTGSVRSTSGAISSKPHTETTMTDLERVADAMQNADLTDGEGNHYRLFDLLDFSGENKARMVTNQLAQAALQSIGYERMREALSEASAAIASLDADALGMVIDGDKAWPARDELLHRIDAALKGDSDRG